MAYNYNLEYKRNTHWSEGLLVDLLNPVAWLFSNEEVVVVPDRYPKAMYHFLVLPRTNISSIFELGRNNLNLLNEMYLAALNVIDMNERQRHEFRIGFHAEPSMLHLHMHVISTDFHSPTLKTQRHYNSFNTALFIPYEELVRRIVVDGRIKKMPHQLVDQLRKLPLHCHRCRANLNTIEDLKAHLMIHLKWQ